MPTAATVLADFAALSITEQNTVRANIARPSFVRGLGIDEYITKGRFLGGRVCPLCGCTHVVRNGKRKDGTQRYICRDCGKSFVVASNSIASGTRKELSVWEKFTECMLSGLSGRKSAMICEINKNTAFVWRHKILDALQNMANAAHLE